MTELTLEALKAKIAVATDNASDAEAIKTAARLRFQRLVNEAGRAACALFTAARMSTKIEGFPTSIDMTGPNDSWNKGICLKFEDGKWGAHIPKPVSGEILWDRSEPGVIRKAMVSMGIADVPGAYEEVHKVVGWNLDSLADEIVEASALLPRHTVEGFFGTGYEIGAMFGLKNADKVSVELAKAAMRLGVDFNSYPVEGEPSLFARLSSSLSLPYLKAVIEAGAVPSGSTIVASAYSFNLDVFDTLLSAGLSVNARGPGGETALHVAVTGATNPPDSDKAISFAWGLFDRGIDIDIVDNADDTAASLLGRRITDIHANGDEDRLDMMVVEELHLMTVGKRLVFTPGPK